MTTDVKLEIIDERKITIPKGVLTNAQTEQIGKFITNAAQEGYDLVGLEDKRASDYRGDSWSTGVTLKFKKPTELPRPRGGVRLPDR